MGIFEAAGSIEKKYAFGFWGMLLTLCTIGVSGFLWYFPNDKPNLSTQILSRTSILDIKEDIPDFQLLYKGTDISKSTRVLSVLLLKVSNLGGKEILIASFDPKVPFSLSAEGAEIVRAEIVGGSNSYLQNNTKFFSPTKSTLVFDPFIIESEQWFLLKILLFHDREKTPRIFPQGKIAGMLDLKEATQEESKEEPIGSQVFSGGLAVQALRLLPYTIGTFIVMVLIGIPVGLLGSWISTRNRRSKVERYKRLNPDLTADDEIIFEIYKSHDVHRLEYIYDSILEAQTAADTKSDTQEKAYQRQRKLMLHRPIHDLYIPEALRHENIKKEQLSTLKDFMKFVNPKTGLELMRAETGWTKV